MAKINTSNKLQHSVSPELGQVVPMPTTATADQYGSNQAEQLESLRKVGLGIFSEWDKIQHEDAQASWLEKQNGIDSSISDIDVNLLANIRTQDDAVQYPKQLEKEANKLYSNIKPINKREAWWKKHNKDNFLKSFRDKALLRSEKIRVELATQTENKVRKNVLNDTISVFSENGFIDLNGNIDFQAIPDYIYRTYFNKTGKELDSETLNLFVENTVLGTLSLIEQSYDNDNNDPQQLNEFKQLTEYAKNKNILNADLNAATENFIKEKENKITADKWILDNDAFNLNKDDFYTAIKKLPDSLQAFISDKWKKEKNIQNEIQLEKNNEGVYWFNNYLLQNPYAEPSDLTAFSQWNELDKFTQQKVMMAAVNQYQTSMTNISIEQQDAENDSIQNKINLMDMGLYEMTEQERLLYIGNVSPENMSKINVAFEKQEKNKSDMMELLAAQPQNVRNFYSNGIIKRISSGGGLDNKGRPIPMPFTKKDMQNIETYFADDLTNLNAIRKAQDEAVKYYETKNAEKEKDIINTNIETFGNMIAIATDGKVESFIYGKNEIKKIIDGVNNINGTDISSLIPFAQKIIDDRKAKVIISNNNNKKPVNVTGFTENLVYITQNSSNPLDEDKLKYFLKNHIPEQKQKVLTMENAPQFSKILMYIMDDDLLEQYLLLDPIGDGNGYKIDKDRKDEFLDLILSNTVNLMRKDNPFNPIDSYSSKLLLPNGQPITPEFLISQSMLEYVENGGTLQELGFTSHSLEKTIELVSKSQDTSSFSDLEFSHETHMNQDTQSNKELGKIEKIAMGLIDIMKSDKGLNQTIRDALKTDDGKGLNQRIREYFTKDGKGLNQRINEALEVDSYSLKQELKKYLSH